MALRFATQALATPETPLRGVLKPTTPPDGVDPRHFRKPPTVKHRALTTAPARCNPLGSARRRPPRHTAQPQLSPRQPLFKVPTMTANVDLEVVGQRLRAARDDR